MPRGVSFLGRKACGISPWSTDSGVERCRRIRGMSGEGTWGKHIVDGLHRTSRSLASRERSRREPKAQSRRGASALPAPRRLGPHSTRFSHDGRTHFKGQGRLPTGRISPASSFFWAACPCRNLSLTDARRQPFSTICGGSFVWPELGALFNGARRKRIADGAPLRVYQPGAVVISEADSITRVYIRGDRIGHMPGWGQSVVSPLAHLAGIHRAPVCLFRGRTHPRFNSCPVLPVHSCLSSWIEISWLLAAVHATIGLVHRLLPSEISGRTVMGGQIGRDRRVGRQIGPRNRRPWGQWSARAFEQLEDRSLLSIGSGWDYDSPSADWFAAPARGRGGLRLRGPTHGRTVCSADGDVWG